MPCKILFCDDSALARSSFHFAFVGSGCKPHVMGDPHQVVEEVQRAAYSKDAYQYIILDLEMEVTGVELAKAIRRNPANKNSKIVFHTSLENGALLDEAKKIGQVIPKVKSFDKMLGTFCEACPVGCRKKV